MTSSRATPQTPGLLEALEDTEDADFGDEATATAAHDDLGQGRPVSRFFLAEKIRMELEQKLGLEVLIKCYDVVQVSASVGVNFGRSKMKISFKIMANI